MTKAIYGKLEQLAKNSRTKRQKEETEEQNLQTIRYKSFVAGTTKKNSVQLQSLIPTENGLREHLKRVYLQIQMWLGRECSPLDWGWENKDDSLVPIKMTQPAAPDNVLRMIFCSCSRGCGVACALFCTYACRNCNGNSCFNAAPVQEKDANDENRTESESEDE